MKWLALIYILIGNATVELPVEMFLGPEDCIHYVVEQATWVKEEYPEYQVQAFCAPEPSANT